MKTLTMKTEDEFTVWDRGERTGRVVYREGLWGYESWFSGSSTLEYHMVTQSSHMDVVVRYALRGYT